MKYLSLLIVLFICSTAYGQRAKIPKGSDRIEITTSLPDSALFENVGVYLEGKGFMVEKSDPKKGTLTTEYRSAKGLTQIRILASVKDHTVIFRGQGQAEAMGVRYSNEPLLYKGMASGLVKGGFIALGEVVEGYAKKVEGSSVRYLAP